ncbi:MAG TPA: hypothetical protein HA230_05385 [Candidatus Aenigmarchaeota archaeon]|nr:hypothetical protein [Candidatus Aenigmarchaeota archaeon]
MDMSALEDIGLTNAEIKVYIALLEMGATKTGPIIEKSGLQSSVVYSALSKLLEKGLVSSVREGKITVYLASDPKNIIDYIDEKKSKLNEILPLLAAKQSLAKNRTDAVLFRGIRGVKELLLELLDAGGKEHHTMGSPLESTMLGSAWWLSYHKKRAAKGIKGKLLFNESLKEWAKKFGYHDRNTEIRFMAKGFEPLTEMIIRNDKVGLIIWTEKPLGILVHNKALAYSWETYFQMDWANAKK